MTGSLRVITAPTEEPLTVDEVWAHLRITEVEEEDLLASYLTAVRVQAEKLLDIAFLTQTLEYAFDAYPWETYPREVYWNGYFWPGDPGWIRSAVELPRAPLQSVTSITYTDTVGTPIVLSSLLYQVDTRSMPGRVAPAFEKSWPATRWQPNAVVVRYVAGATDPTLVPEDQKQLLRLAVGALYEYREDVIDGSAGSTGLLEQFFAPYRNAMVV